MSRIRGRDTKCEVMFRKYAWSKGIKGYRVRSGMLGKPDMYFPKQKLAIFVDGCFWHKCPQCFIKPRNNKTFWGKKIASNVRRDANVKRRLSKESITVLRFWEHEVEHNLHSCYKRLERILGRLERWRKATV